MVVAERFEAPKALAFVSIPIGEWANVVDAAIGLDVTIVDVDRGDRRQTIVDRKSLSGQLTLDLSFEPLRNDAGALFALLIQTTSKAGLTPTPDMLASIGRRAPIRIATRSANWSRSTPQVAYAIEQSWSDSSGVFLQGWLHAFNDRVTAFRIKTGRFEYTTEHLASRPDLAKILPQFPYAGQSGFAVYVPWEAGSPIVFEVTTGEGLWREDILMPRPATSDAVAYSLTDGMGFRPRRPTSDREDPLVTFLGAVQGADLFVVEVGSRSVSENWMELRHKFPPTTCYIGLDIHAGPNVDLVGDAHQLHELVGEAVLDATFSLSVMEHLTQRRRR